MVPRGTFFFCRQPQNESRIINQTTGNKCDFHPDVTYRISSTSSHHQWQLRQSYHCHQRCPDEHENTAAHRRLRRDLLQRHCPLTGQSVSAVEWLQDIFSLDLSLVPRLGATPIRTLAVARRSFPA
ncbi:hypothetical protein BC938DRAFT_472669 [Jimgerdemannia flammicorona]|uniref:Uncharacterized protein n=1 Tax=Jimgerdemannia flammicorona TaxID=994334 RepID=A0A433QTX0_9FUNG|nr:hypothetical protein BC938DRAFT_472669 [Jimgerdemannia flammicorona]